MYNNESGNENNGRYMINDPDLIDSEDEAGNDGYRKPMTPPGTPIPFGSFKSAADGTTGTGENKDAFDTNGMVEYKVNWLGWIFSLGAIGYYGWVLFDQMRIQLPTIYDDMMPINLAFKLRYIGIFAYFLACLFRRTYIFECRNAEAPLIVSTVMELYYQLSYKERNGEPPFVFELLLPLAVTIACFMRRKPYWRFVMNPWTKDKSELMRVIQAFRESNERITDL